MRRGPVPRDEAERFFEKVIKTDTCWLWTANKDHNGYGKFRIGSMIDGSRRVIAAHKWLWEKVNGLVAPGLELDHKCRVRHCVRPDHLEAVTHAENILRGEAPSALQARQTHCKHGHLFDEINTYEWRGHRVCRPCHARREADRRKAAV